MGRYTLEVGWRDEPALEGALNAVQVEVHETANGRAIPGLSKALRVAVSFGGVAQTFAPVLYERPSEPGTYFGDFIPTRTGDYIFRVTGRIGDLAVDERFESGPGRFDPVTAPASLQFPDQVGSIAGAARELHALREDIGQLRLLAIAGVLLGIGGLGLVSRRRPGR